MQTAPRILLVEDDPNQMMVLKDYLVELGYHVLEARSGVEGLASARRNLPDLVVADWLMPQMTGVELCEQLRESGYTGPLVLLTSKSDLDSQLGGLKRGADDYWIKPVPLKLIQAKIEALLRRKQTETFAEVAVDIGAAKFDAARAVLIAEGKELELNPKEAGILKLLLLKEGAPVSRDRLLASVWGYDNLPNTRTVDNYVMSLRRKLETAAGAKVSIVTKRSLGYLLVRDGGEA